MEESGAGEGGRLTFSHPVETFSEGGGEKGRALRYQTPTYCSVHAVTH